MLILLADDEKYVRLGLQSMIEELFPEENQFIQAGNGREVVALMKERRPDVAFLDIKMPFMDGLEALRICKELSPDTLWIILSGYESFEYARQALSLSAYEYIVKPVDIDTLSPLFERIHDNRSGRREERNRAFVHDITRTFNMAQQLPEEEVEFLPARPSDYILYQFYMDFSDMDAERKIKQTLLESLDRFCRENALIVDHCIFFNGDGNLCLVCDTPDASRLTHFIFTQGEKLMPNAFSVFFGNNKEIRNIFAISRRIHQFAEIRLLINCQNPVYYKNIEVLPDLNRMLQFAGELLELHSLLLSDNWMLCQQKIKAMAANRNFRALYPQVDIPVLENHIRRLFRTGKDCGSYDRLLAALERSAADRSASPCLSTTTNIEHIKEYVCHNYAADLSVNSVSEIFHVSPTYFSRMFHEKTGQKYIDYVTGIRMEVAMKLLADNPGANIRQIAELTGFTSSRYFSKLFQKYTGVVPSEYGKSYTSK